MQMQQVRYFLALCEDRNFTRAAKRLAVSQPSLTKAIQKLEGELGGALFYRSRCGVTLTPRGAHLQPYFVNIEQSITTIKTEAVIFPNAVTQTNWRKELSMSRNLLLSAVILLPIIGIGGFVNTSVVSDPSKSETAMAIAVDPHALHLAADMSVLPETQIKEPF